MPADQPSDDVRFARTGVRGGLDRQKGITRLSARDPASVHDNNAGYGHSAAVEEGDFASKTSHALAMPVGSMQTMWPSANSTGPGAVRGRGSEADTVGMPSSVTAGLFLARGLVRWGRSRSADVRSDVDAGYGTGAIGRRLTGPRLRSTSTSVVVCSVRPRSRSSTRAIHLDHPHRRARDRDDAAEAPGDE